MASTMFIMSDDLPGMLYCSLIVVSFEAELYIISWCLDQIAV